MYTLKISGSGYDMYGESLGEVETLVEARRVAARNLNLMDQYVTASDNDGPVAHFGLGSSSANDHILITPVRTQTVDELPA